MSEWTELFKVTDLFKVTVALIAIVNPIGAFRYSSPQPGGGPRRSEPEFVARQDARALQQIRAGYVS
jgi:hypothetical protein